MTKTTATENYQLPLTDEKAMLLARFVLKSINEASNISDLQKITENDPVLVNLMPNIKKYPKLTLRLTKDDLASLVNNDLVIVLGKNEKYQKLSSTLASGMKPGGIPMTGLEKLLYAMLWKNGDLGKEKHIVNGMKEGGHADQHGHVFYEFGGYLNSQHSYIFDQHTLRCFITAKTKDEKNICKARRMRIVTQALYNAWIDEYKKFYTDLENKNLLEKKDFLYQVDRILFACGKLIKL
jgi:hypothetical protein